MNADRIERELILPAPVARVWAALTVPRHLSAWFGTSASVDLRPGGEISFTWDRSAGVRGTNRCVVVAVEPPRRFAFRWRPFGGFDGVPILEGPNTLVEFTLHEHAEGTLLRLVESGFDSLPASVRGCRERNVEGWQRELADLLAFLSASAP